MGSSSPYWKGFWAPQSRAQPARVCCRANSLRCNLRKRNICVIQNGRCVGWLLPQGDAEMRKRQKIAAMEKPFEKFTGGLRCGKRFSWAFCENFNATIPFASLIIEEGECVFRVSFLGIETASFTLPFSDVEYVERLRIFPCCGLRFWHKNSKVPKLLIFWTFFNSRKICTALSGRGVCVKS